MLQGVQLTRPELPVLRRPVGHHFQLFQIGAAKPLAAFLPDGDEPALRQYPDVFGNGRAADLEIIRNGVEVQRACRQQTDDLTPGWICYGLEYISSHFPVFIIMKPFGYKYT